MNSVRNFRYTVSNIPNRHTHPNTHTKTHTISHTHTHTHKHVLRHAAAFFFPPVLVSQDMFSGRKWTMAIKLILTPVLTPNDYWLVKAKFYMKIVGRLIWHPLSYPISLKVRILVDVGSMPPQQKILCALTRTRALARDSWRWGDVFWKTNKKLLVLIRSNIFNVRKRNWWNVFAYTRE